MFHDPYGRRGWCTAVVVGIATMLNASAGARAAIGPTSAPERTTAALVLTHNVPEDLDEIHARAHDLLYEQNRYGQADELYAQECALRREAEGRSRALAECLSERGVVRWRTRDLDGALDFLQQSVVIHEEAGSPEGTMVQVLTLVANIYKRRFQLDKALRLYERVLEIHQRNKGAVSMEASETLVLMASVYEAHGSYEDATRLYESALDIRQSLLGPGHEQVADILMSIGVSHLGAGEHEKALPFLERALVIHEKALGPDHPNVATDLHYLGWHHLERGKHEEMQPLLERALAIDEKALGPNHPNVASDLRFLGWAHSLRGQYDLAQPLLERALAIGEKALGPDHHLVIPSLHALGELHARRNRIDEAIPLRRRAFDIEYYHLTHTLLFAEEHRRLDFAAKAPPSVDIALSLHLQAAPSDLSASALALTTLLRRKSIVHDLGASPLLSSAAFITPSPDHLVSRHWFGARMEARPWPARLGAGLVLLKV